MTAQEIIINMMASYFPQINTSKLASSICKTQNDYHKKPSNFNNLKTITITNLTSCLK